MTDLDRPFGTTADLTVEERLAILEARAGLVTPLALVPPITVGELTDVPAPGSQIAAQWAQEVSSRVVQRFPTTAGLKAWAAPNGALAVALDTGIVWRRRAAVWSMFSPYQNTAVGTAWDGTGGIKDVNLLQIPADAVTRTAYVSCFLQVGVLSSTAAHVKLIVAGGVLADAQIPATIPIALAGVNMVWNISLGGNYNLPTDNPVDVQLQVSATIGGGPATILTYADATRNRLDVVVLPR